MTGKEWFERFRAVGPGFEGVLLPAAEVQALLLNAATADGLPLRHAQDFSALAPLLLSDPLLIGMAAAALDGDHHAPHIEGTEEHIVVERARILMAAPLVVDALVGGGKRAVLHDIDWAPLLGAYLAHAGRVYDLAFRCDNGPIGTVMITVADKSNLGPYGDLQSVPYAALKRLTALAEKSQGPATRASPISGAGAGPGDTD